MALPFNFTLKQTFAAGVRRTYTKPTSGAQRPVADDFTLQLHWCNAERTAAKIPRCAGIKEKSWFFLSKNTGVLFLDVLLLCLFGGERQDSEVRPFLASSPLSIAKADVSEISNRLPDYLTLKITAMKPENAQYQEKSTLSGHTQRCSDGSGWEQHRAGNTWCTRHMAKPRPQVGRVCYSWSHH